MNREKVYSIYDVICLNVFLHKFYNEISLLKTEYNLSAILLKFLLIAVDFFMHQSIPAAPSRPVPPRDYCGACENFVLPGDRAFGNPGASPELLTPTRLPVRI